MSRFWQNFLSDHKQLPTPAYLGLQGYGVPLNRALTQRFQADEGILVRSVDPRGPAEEAGILEGDILLSLGEHRLRNADDLAHTLEQLAAGVLVTVFLLRAGRCIERLLLPRGKRRRVRQA